MNPWDKADALAQHEAATRVHEAKLRSRAVEVGRAAIHATEIGEGPCGPACLGACQDLSEAVFDGLVAAGWRIHGPLLGRGEQ